ncbi:hypothetical protein F4560_006840 [Saccharothrix ecbatanensis]|uniref:Uncharacterized protein n=1 Tax=Saccharothrix ecbatanensis TaxID=1105145 RepID=A0A7W9M4G0_9PSEU|nr:hypothetical protein [Saccharothrix ecbatanensis]
MPHRLTGFRDGVEQRAQMVELHPIEFHSFVGWAPS